MLGLNSCKYSTKSISSWSAWTQLSWGESSVFWLIDWLIVCLVFTAVSAIFQSCNGDCFDLVLWTKWWYIQNDFKGFLWELGLPLHCVYRNVCYLYIFHFELSKGMKTKKALSGDSKTRGRGGTILPTNVLFEHTLKNTLDRTQSYLLATMTLGCGDGGRLGVRVPAATGLSH